jgi:hypothetical protein
VAEGEEELMHIRNAAQARMLPRVSTTVGVRT